MTSHPVVCSTCGAHVYDVNAKRGELMLPATLTPAHPDVRQPALGELIVCPLCGSLDFIHDLRNSIPGP